MGLCKCPRKKVTTLFCFEHRVNVCEHCLVANHSKCIVQSYLQWLQDSDHDPNCQLCGQLLSCENRDTIRLTCLHIFHCDCFNSWALQHPPNTAPAGYMCPTCQGSVFPKANHVSPVADTLREQLSKMNWARAGLALPLLSDDELPYKFSPLAVVHGTVDNRANKSAVVNMDMNNHESATLARKTLGNDTTVRTELNDPALLASALNTAIDKDTDENKYKRRSAFEWFSRWIKSRTVLAPRRHDPMSTCKRVLFMLVLFIIVLMTVITILTRVGRSQADHDPFLDPRANPNIRVAQLSE